MMFLDIKIYLIFSCNRSLHLFINDKSQNGKAARQKWTPSISMKTIFVEVLLKL